MILMSIFYCCLGEFTRKFWTLWEWKDKINLNFTEIKHWMRKYLRPRSVRISWFFFWWWNESEYKKSWKLFYFYNSIPNENFQKKIMSFLFIVWCEIISQCVFYEWMHQFSWSFVFLASQFSLHDSFLKLILFFLFKHI